jgi:hypothetical protein
MRGEIIYEYQKLNSEDQKVFRRCAGPSAPMSPFYLPGGWYALRA